MKGICFLCGNWENLETHHIYGGARRSASDRYGMTVRLCHDCHQEDRDSAHRSGATKLYLHKYGERKLLRQGWTVEQFIAVFERNYLDADELEDLRLEQEAMGLDNSDSFQLIPEAAMPVLPW